MQAIQTKYLGPTNTRGSRIKAACWLANITVPFDHALDVDGNHSNAINALVGKINQERKSNGNTDLYWEVKATGDSVDGKGMTAIITLK